jgi:hypothetical protein
VNRKPLLSRFEEKVEKTDGCWIWRSAFTERGYGVFWINGGNKYAHRLSYELYKGEIPAGLVVMHSCDNPACVNPDHLSVGTYKDNSQDAVKKGRNAYGERNGSAKLSVQQVLEIEKLLKEGKHTHRHIGSMFGVSKCPVGRIARNLGWKLDRADRHSETSQR